jgi:ADP-ribose pyrophosphatase
VGEALEDCARRELLEETGYTAAKWRGLGFLYASPGVLDEKLHLFVAEELTLGPASPEADEQLEPVRVRFDDAIRMCLNGEIKDAKTITSLLLWERINRRG